MRWPIRRQILWPFAGVVALSVTALTALAAARAARHSENEIRLRLERTVETLAHLPGVPYTSAVLDNMRGLSGAHFVACDASDGVVASTLPEGADFSLQMAVDQQSPDGLQGLGESPTLTFGDARYYTARFQPRADSSVRSLFVLYPEDSWIRARRDAALPPLTVGAATLLLTSVVALWLADRFSRRLRQLQVRVAAIAAGDFREIPLGDRQDEIQDLAASVNSMSSQLSKMRETIRTAERAKLLAQLASGLAHQLRNAVTGAGMALQLHQRRCPAAAHDRSLDVTRRQLALTETQVKGLLSLGRVENHPRSPCDIAELLHEVADLLEPTCEHANVQMARCDRGPGPLVADVDVEGLRAAVLNLALNAIEAAGSNGLVGLGARNLGSMVAVEVTDSGPGPQGDLASSLFDPFVTSKPEGVGLGLSLARQVAVDNGGALEWSRHDGRTVFRLTLPAAAQEMHSVRGDRINDAAAFAIDPSHSALTT